MISDSVFIPKVIKTHILLLIIPPFLTFLICKFVLIPITVASGSMEPMLKVGNCVYYSGIAYYFDEPQRGQIILFRSNEYNKYMAKRVIGIPGDHVEFIDGHVFINGLLADESKYLPTGTNTYCNKVFDVPEKSVFVMGDNREYSKDSRYFKQPYIAYRDIKGKYVFQTKFNVKYRIKLFINKHKK